MVSEQFVLRMT